MSFSFLLYQLLFEFCFMQSSVLLLSSAVACLSADRRRTLQSSVILVNNLEEVERM